MRLRPLSGLGRVRIGEMGEITFALRVWWYIQARPEPVSRLFYTWPEAAYTIDDLLVGEQSPVVELVPCIVADGVPIPITDDVSLWCGKRRTKAGVRYAEGIGCEG